MKHWERVNNAWKSHDGSSLDLLVHFRWLGFTYDLLWSSFDASFAIAFGWMDLEFLYAVLSTHPTMEMV